MYSSPSTKATSSKVNTNNNNCFVSVRILILATPSAVSMVSTLNRIILPLYGKMK